MTKVKQQKASTTKVETQVATQQVAQVEKRKRYLRDANIALDFAMQNKSSVSKSALFYIKRIIALKKSNVAVSRNFVRYCFTVISKSAYDADAMTLKSIEQQDALANIANAKLDAFIASNERARFAMRDFKQ